MSGAGPHRSSKQKGVSNFVVRGTFFCLFDDGNVRESMLAVGDSPGQRTRKRRRAM
jgi:hypothetical protein